MANLTKDWFTHHTAYWKTWLQQYANRPNLLFLEVGSFEGRSAVWLLENILTGLGSRLVCCDSWTDPILWIDEKAEIIEGRFDSNTSRFGEKITKLKGKSVEVLIGLASERKQFDFIYLDGEHYGPTVYTEAALAFRLLKTGGLLIFDDYYWKAPAGSGINIGPRETIDGFCQVFRQEIICTHSRTGQVACWKTGK